MLFRSLTKEEEAELNGWRSMLDHDDIASLDSSLILNPHLARDYRGKTLAAINKKQVESGAYEDHPNFNDELKNVVDTHGRTDAQEYIAKNASKKENMFYSEKTMEQQKAAGEVAQAHKEAIAANKKLDELSIKQKDLEAKIASETLPGRKADIQRELTATNEEMNKIKGT